MEVDHIFIMSAYKGQEANDLIHFGLSEGSSRVHMGQGTINRKFYFENFFLELLWVHDEKEARSKITTPTQLWERSQFLTNNFSRFGLCLANTPNTDELFQDALIYQPGYFPEGLAIEMIPSSLGISIPWLFRLPFKGLNKHTKEPTSHKTGLQQLTKVIFGVGESNLSSTAIELINASDTIQFKQSNTIDLLLEFDQGCQGKRRYFPSLNLAISY